MLCSLTLNKGSEILKCLKSSCVNFTGRLGMYIQNNFRLNKEFKINRKRTLTPEEFMMYQIDGTRPNCWKRLLMRFPLSIVKKFPYLHKLDNLVVDYKARNVQYSTQDQDLLPILSMRQGKSLTYSILSEDFEKFNDIIKKRELRNFARVENDLLKLNTEKNQRGIQKLKDTVENIETTIKEINSNIMKIFNLMKAP